MKFGNYVVFAVTKIRGRKGIWMAIVITLAGFRMGLRIKSKIEGWHPQKRECKLMSRFDRYRPSHFIEVAEKLLLSCRLISSYGWPTIFVFIFVFFSPQLREMRSEIKLLEDDKQRLEVIFTFCAIVARAFV